MPKIRIKERDLTTNPAVSVNEQYILYVLGNEERLIAGGFESAISEKTAPRVITQSEADALAKAEREGGVDSFLSEVVSLGGRVVVAYDWKVAQEYCGDRNQYDIKFIIATEGKTAIEGVEDVPAKSEVEVALAIAQTRKDCVVIYSKVNPTYNAIEKGILETKCEYIGTAGDASTTDKGFFSDELKQPCGKYVAAFYAPNPGIHKVNDTETFLHPGEAYLLALLNNLNNNYTTHDAVAGAVKGGVPNNYVVDGFLKEADIDNMQLRVYNKDNFIAINPIVNMNPWGTRIWGNRTCLPNKNVVEGTTPRENSDQLVASSFLNVRLLICELKKAIYRAGRRIQFEQNTDVTWVNFTSQINTLLEELKSSYGIAAYRWYREDTTERAKIKAILRIVPIEAIEDIDLTIELADSVDAVVAE